MLQLLRRFLIPKGHPNHITGSKVTAILLNGGFCPLVELHREGSAPTACAAGLFSYSTWEVCRLLLMFKTLTKLPRKKVNVWNSTRKETSFNPRGSTFNGLSVDCVPYTRRNEHTEINMHYNPQSSSEVHISTCFSKSHHHIKASFVISPFLHRQLKMNT